MTRILTIARNTFRENIRDKVLYNLILFALIMIVSSIAIGQLALGNEARVILSLGLSAISLFGALIAIFIGIGLVYKELEKRTVYVLLSKPVRRHELILGKYLGLLFTLLVNVAIMAAGLELALFYQGNMGLEVHLRVLPALYLIFLSLALVTAVALLFSTFSTPALSALFTFFIWIIGHFGNDLRNLSELTKSVFMKTLYKVLYYVIPNITNFEVIDSRNVIQSAAYNRPVDPQAILWVTVYCLFYCAALILLSASVFSRRDFK